MRDYFDEIMDVITRAEHLGCRTASTGARLIGHVPHVAPLAYFHTIYPPLSEEDIAELETGLGRSLPRDFQDFLRRTNGINLFADTLSLSGLRRSFERTFEEACQPYSLLMPNVISRPQGIPDDLVYIGRYSEDGSQLAMLADSDTVCRCRRWTADVLNEWPRFEEMLVSETHRLAALFDDQGRQINPDESTLPK